jgi:hypothetical protein
MLSFVVCGSVQEADSVNGYLEMFDEPNVMRYYPPIKWLNHGTWNHTITVSSPVTGFPSDEDLGASWSLALSKLMRVVGEPQGWSPALGSHGVHQRTWSRYEPTPHYEVIGLSVIKAS